MIILASISPRRSSLLRAAGIPFRIHMPRITEKEARHLPSHSPRQLVLHNARLKAGCAAKKFPKKWILSADTLVVLGRQVLGKPRHMADAHRMLASLCGKTHRVITGVCLFHPQKRRVSFTVTTRVTFKKLNAASRSRYLRLIHPLDKAGAYAAQEHTDKIIQSIQGSFTNVVGLPMEKLLKTFRTLRILQKKTGSSGDAKTWGKF